MDHDPEVRGLVRQRVGRVAILCELRGRTQHDVGACFSVPAPAAGSYTLIVTAANVDPDPAGLTFEL